MVRKINNCNCKCCSSELKGSLSNWAVQDIRNVVREEVKNIQENKYTKPMKVDKHLFYIEYENYDYKDGYDYMTNYRKRDAEQLSELKPSYGSIGAVRNFACSAVVKDTFFGRNFDWYFDIYPTIVVKTLPVGGRIGTIGVVFPVSQLSEEIVQEGKDNEAYKVLPFFVTDIMNDYNVTICTNVVSPGDKGYTTGTGMGEQEICSLMLPRYLADYAKSAKEAVEMIQHFDVFAPLNFIGEELHLMISDLTDTYVVEFVNNDVSIMSNTDGRYPNIPNNINVMTNSYLTDWNGEFKTVYGGYSEEEVRATGLTDHAMGLERAKVLTDNYDMAQDVLSMDRLMQKARYTDTYKAETSPRWFSEFVGYTDTFGELNIYNTAEDYAGIYAKAVELYEQQIRGKQSWITLHSSVYDMKNKKLYVHVEEDYNKIYQFALNTLGESTGIDDEEFNERFDDRFEESVEDSRFRTYVVRETEPGTIEFVRNEYIE